jgi:hypothetical protein
LNFIAAAWRRFADRVTFCANRNESTSEVGCIFRRTPPTPRDPVLVKIAIGLIIESPEGWRMTLSRMVRNHGLQLKEDLHEYFVPFVASDTSSAGYLIEPWRQVATKEAVP